MKTTKSEVQMWFVDELHKKESKLLLQATDPHMMDELMYYPESGIDEILDDLKPMIAQYLWERWLNEEKVEIVG